MNSVFVFALLVAIHIVCVTCQIPCDDVYGQYCPEESGLSVGECIKKLDSSLVSSDCLKYIELHEICKDDIVTHCVGKEYTGDLVSCLSDWTKPELISEQCLAMLPKKEVAQKRELTPEEKKKADARRKIRNKAAKMARDL